ncbi:hypothetical protein BB558_006627, partial [Smittium angustum]
EQTVEEDESLCEQNHVSNVEDSHKPWFRKVFEAGKLYCGSIMSEDEENMVECGEPGNTWGKELHILTDRAWLRQRRDRSLIYSYLFISIAAMFGLGFTFFNPGENLEKIQNTTGLIFLITLYLLFLVALPLLLILDAEKKLMKRERSFKLYRVSTFLFALTFAILPILLLTNFIMLTGVYFLAKFQPVFTKYLIYMLIYMSTIICSFSFAVAAISVFPTFQLASVISPLILSVFGIFGGNLINPKNIPPALSWIRFISYFYYSYTAAIKNEFGGMKFNCSNITGQVCYTTGEQVIDAYGDDIMHILV